MRLWALDMGSLSAWCFFGDEVAEDGLLRNLDSWLTAFATKMEPTHVCACFDGANNFRKKIAPDYKLGRKQKPDHFVAQLRQVPALVEKHGIVSLRTDGLEADDLIASVANKHASPNVEVICVSEDSDLFAIVSEHVKEYAPSRGIYFDVAAVVEKMQLPPHRIPDFKALAGDSSDNIGGVKGIGKKYAREALRSTRSMAELFRRAAAGQLPNLKPATQALLANGRDQYEEAIKLVTLRLDAPVPDTVDAFRIGQKAAA